MDIAELLQIAVSRKASDLHLTVGAPPTLRMNGSMEGLEMDLLTRESIHRMIYDVLNDEQKSRFEEHHDMDFSVELANVARFRVNIFVGRTGEGAVFRVIPTKIMSLKDLGLPDILEHLTEHDRGLVLVTGPTGSGKSTTLAAMVDLVNTNRKGHILTIEDPIEFVHTHKGCIVNQREVGPHTESFGSALRAALREDPDVILVGEMRDLETISLAVTAAETGHLVFGTLHTSSAAQTIDRIIDVFPPHQQSQIRAQLAESIQGIVAQTLIPTADEHGRVAAVEIMTGSAAVRNLIRDGKTFQLLSVIQTSSGEGMQSKDQSLRDLLKLRKITMEQALKHAVDRISFIQTVQEAGIMTQPSPVETPSQPADDLSQFAMKPIIFRR